MDVIVIDAASNMLLYLKMRIENEKNATAPFVCYVGYSVRRLFSTVSSATGRAGTHTCYAASPDRHSFASARIGWPIRGNLLEQPVFRT
jgi:hypothetical protein